MSFNISNFSQASQPSSQGMLPQPAPNLSLEGLFQRMQALEANQAQLHELLTELQTAKSTITRLQAQNDALQAQLQALQKDLATPSTRTTTSASDLSAKATSYVPKKPAVESWATLAAKNRPQQLPRSVRRVAAAFRAFQEPDPTAPQGFMYIYVPRVRKMSRAEIRRLFRTIGIETSRILDINFPARNKMGLLIHNAYKDTIMDILKTGKVKVDLDLDPRDPALLEDPKFKDMTLAKRTTEAMTIHENRCIAALKRLRADLIPSVGLCFIDNGWINQDQVDYVIKQVTANSSAHKKRKSPPGDARDAAFADLGANASSDDEDMSDIEQETDAPNDEPSGSDDSRHLATSA